MAPLTRQSQFPVPEMAENKFLLFKATKSVLLCYAALGTQRSTASPHHWRPQEAPREGSGYRPQASAPGSDTAVAQNQTLPTTSWSRRRQKVPEAWVQPPGRLNPSANVPPAKALPSHHRDRRCMTQREEHKVPKPRPFRPFARRTSLASTDAFYRETQRVLPAHVSTTANHRSERSHCGRSPRGLGSGRLCGCLPWLPPTTPQRQSTHPFILLPSCPVMAPPSKMLHVQLLRSKPNEMLSRKRIQRIPDRLIRQHSIPQLEKMGVTPSFKSATQARVFVEGTLHFAAAETRPTFANSLKRSFKMVEKSITRPFVGHLQGRWLSALAPSCRLPQTWVS